MTQTSGAYVHRPPQSSSSSSSLSEPDQVYTELSKGCGKEHSDILSAARLWVYLWPVELKYCNCNIPPSVVVIECSSYIVKFVNRSSSIETCIGYSTTVLGSPSSRSVIGTSDRGGFRGWNNASHTWYHDLNHECVPNWCSKEPQALNHIKRSSSALVSITINVLPRTAGPLSEFLYSYLLFPFMCTLGKYTWVCGRITTWYYNLIVAVCGFLRLDSTLDYMYLSCYPPFRFGLGHSLQ